MDKEINPFLVSGYHGEAYFCDRKEETATLKQYIESGINVTLFAKRRLGKTGLIYHVFNQYKSNKSVVCIYVDILAATTLSEFTNILATAVYNRFQPQKSIGKRITDMFKMFRPIISFDELSGTPSISLRMDTQAQKQNTINQIFTFLDKQNIKIVFAIDEFQQILQFPEQNTEALLRTYIQSLKNISFIFCGSNQKMMHEIFNSAKRPFFASCTNMHLGYISEAEYHRFISQNFKSAGREITYDCILFILEFTKSHTFYTQYFCHSLYALNHKKNDLQEAKETAISILKVNENTFFQYRNLLTEAQWNLLKAIAKEERVTKPQSKDFINKHQLGTPSLVSRGLEALLTKELVFQDLSAETPYYEVYDKFLMRWLKHKQ